MLNILILSCIGFICSVYLFIVEQKVKQDPLYKASCDISDKFSCTKPILTPYSKLFFISNALLGMVFYMIVGILALIDQTTLIFYISIPACLVSIYLALISYLKIEVFCIVCTIIYLINISILFLSYLNL